MRLRDVALELSRRVVSLFVANEEGRRPCHGDDDRYTYDAHWNDLVLFYEYFHPETGRGCGARWVCRDRRRRFGKSFPTLKLFADRKRRLKV